MTDTHATYEAMHREITVAGLLEQERALSERHGFSPAAAHDLMCRLVDIADDRALLGRLLEEPSDNVIQGPW